MLGQQIEPDIAAIARQRQVELAGTRPNDTLHPEERKVGEKRWHRTTNQQVADAVGIGGASTYYKHRKVIEQAREEAPELVPYIESGDLTIADVKRELKTRQPITPSGYPPPANRPPPPRPGQAV